MVSVRSGDVLVIMSLCLFFAALMAPVMRTWRELSDGPDQDREKPSDVAQHRRVHPGCPLPLNTVVVADSGCLRVVVDGEPSVHLARSLTD